MAGAAIPSDLDILTDVVSPGSGNMSPEVAQAVLKLRFSRTATSRIRKLLQKNNRGTISAPERVLLDRYLRVGQLIDLLHGKAHVSLKSMAEDD